MAMESKAAANEHLASPFLVLSEAQLMKPVKSLISC